MLQPLRNPGERRRGRWLPLAVPVVASVTQRLFLVPAFVLFALGGGQGAGARGRAPVAAGQSARLAGMFHAPGLHL